MRPESPGGKGGSQFSPHMRRDTVNSRSNFSGPPECTVHADPTKIIPTNIHMYHLSKPELGLDGFHEEHNPKVKTPPKRRSVED